MDQPSDRDIAAAICELLDRRGPGRTICPSDAARHLGDAETWRALMPAVHRVAADLSARGVILLTQRGKPVDPATLRGAYRLRRPTEAR